MTTTTKEDTYNGWTNRATWHTQLVISNRRSSYKHWSETAKMVAQSPLLGASALAKKMRREIGRRYVQDDVQDQAVNWREIAESWIDEAEDALELEQ